jgi:signal peptidase I
MKACGYCGRQNDDDAACCRECGKEEFVVPTPPPLPRNVPGLNPTLNTKAVGANRRGRMPVGAAILVVAGGVSVVGLIVLRLADLICPFSVPTGAMAPAVSSGDHVIMEGLTYLSRKPRLGDIVVFKSEGLQMLPPSTYLKRVAGQPGDRLRISDGKLYVNEAQVALSNANGQIHYVNMTGSTYLVSSNDTATIPDGHYFVLGDNSTNSLDSRYWGFLPAGNIRGRVSFCYWPPGRVGPVK